MNANGEPIKPGTGSFGRFLSDGQMLDSQEMEDGSVPLSPEAIAVLGEEFGKQEQPLSPHVLRNPAPTDEEWRLQEAFRGNRRLKMKDPEIETLNDLKIFVRGKFEHLGEKFSTKLEEIDKHLKELKNSLTAMEKTALRLVFPIWKDSGSS